jgi:drug/metabolite transporter (DMT)-like permease
LLAVALGLGSSLCWGLADFFGGLQSRRRSLLAVLLVSQVLALALLGLFALAFAGGDRPSASAVGWAALAGTVGCFALAAFYRGLAIGTMSVVAPLSATGAAVPVLVGVAEGERPGAIQVAGMVLALAGILLASREAPREDETAAQKESGRRASRAAVGLALVAALGFGTFFVGVDRASETAGVTWVILVSRSCSLALVAAAALVVRPELPRAAAALLPLAAVGVLDLGANGLYALATTKGLLSIVAVLGSLYPAVTVVLARLVLAERLTRTQGLGVLATLLGVVAISAG